MVRLLVIISFFITSGSLLAVSPDTETIRVSDFKSQLYFENQDGIIVGRIDLNKVFLQAPDLYAEDYYQLSVPLFVYGGKPGTPALPVYNKLVEISEGEEYRFEITRIDSVVIDLNEWFSEKLMIPILESVQKGNPRKDTLPQKNERIYSSDNYFRLPLLDLHTEGKSRGMQVGRIQVSPFAYNPVRNTLVVYRTVHFKCIPLNNTLASEYDIQSPVFERILRKKVLMNSVSSLRKKVITDSPVTMVVLADDMYRETLKPFIQWKTKKGFNIIEAYTSDPEVGNTRASIRSYLTDLYFSPPAGYAPQTYLLIVGESNQVPTSDYGIDTDVYYTTYDGAEDYLPEAFHGRISVKNTEELQAVLDKILTYEKFQMPVPSYLNKSLLIAGYDNTYASLHGNGQINYAADYYFNEAHGIEAGVFLHPEASTMDAEIREMINEGAGFVNYTGHGDEDGWLDPGFRKVHLSSFDQNEKYGVIVTNGCRTNVFSGTTDCFAEAALKAPGKVAVGYIGCSGDSFWDEDFYWSVGVGEITANPVFDETGYGFYDKVFHDSLNNTEFWAPSLGEMIFAGNMSVQESTSLYKEYYWRIYQLMGDPSLVPWFTVPGQPEVVYPGTLEITDASFLVEASPYDYVAISSNGVLLDARHCDAAGDALMYIPEGYRGDTLLLVVTGDKRAPYIRQIPDRGYLEIGEITFTNETKIQDNQLSSGESASFSMVIKNISANPTGEDQLLIDCGFEGILIEDSLVFIPSIAPFDSLIIEEAFPFTLTENIPDQTRLQFTLSRVSSPDYGSMHFQVDIAAANVNTVSFNILDANTGNGDGIFDPGEEIQFQIDLENSGSYASDSVFFYACSPDGAFDKMKILEGKPLDVSAVHRYIAQMVIPEQIDVASVRSFDVVIYSGVSSVDTLECIIGRYVEDFTDEAYLDLKWSRMEWQRDTTEYLSAPASLRSSEIGHNQSSSFGIQVHVVEPASIVFNYKVSSEHDYDFLTFYLDSMEMGKWSGEIDWTIYSLDLTEGIHDLNWVYAKDVNTTGGKDAAWIDHIVFVPDAFIRNDLRLDSIIVQRAGSNLGKENMDLVVTNLGYDAVTSFQVAYRSNGDPWNFYDARDTIPPDSSRLISLPDPIDFSAIGSYLLEVRLLQEDDLYSQNDTMSTVVEHTAFPDISITEVAFDSVSGNYVDLIARLYNEGNIAVENLFYEIVIDSVYGFSGVIIALLEPDSTMDVTFNLLNEYNSWLEAGWHSYTLQIQNDSVNANNRLEGTVYWSEVSYVPVNVSGIMVYPNPIKSDFMLRLTGSFEVPVELTFVTVSGKEIYRAMVDHKETRIPGSIFPSEGIYFGILQNASDNIVHRFKVIYRGM